ncbi:MAG TPA: hypothetical protein VFD41_04520 [Actinomycetales bacterium]|nr:hypothetical protein [Actinomycetales bacterium]
MAWCESRRFAVWVEHDDFQQAASGVSANHQHPVLTLADEA